jgi:hypothetical protein
MRYAVTAYLLLFDEDRPEAAGFPVVDFERPNQ